LLELFASNFEHAVNLLCVQARSTQPLTTREWEMSSSISGGYLKVTVGQIDMRTMGCNRLDNYILSWLLNLKLILNV